MLDENESSITSKDNIASGQKCQQPVGEGTYRKIWASRGDGYKGKNVVPSHFMEGDQTWL